MALVWCFQNETAKIIEGITQSAWQQPHTKWTYVFSCVTFEMNAIEYYMSKSTQNFAKHIQHEHKKRTFRQFNFISLVSLSLSFCVLNCNVSHHNTRKWFRSCSKLSSYLILMQNDTLENPVHFIRRNVNRSICLQHNDVHRFRCLG